MADVLVKIRALLALTTSPNVDEARNAALVAARLIREHGIILTNPAASVGMTFPPPQIRITVTKKTTPAPVADDADEWQRIKAKYEGFCKWCGKTIRKNSSIRWCPGKGAMHLACYTTSEQ